MESLDQICFLGLDVETTGVSPLHDRIIEIGLALGRRYQRPQVYARLIRPDRPIHPLSQAVHGIDEEMVQNAPAFYETVREWNSWIEQARVVVGHNVLDFDMPFINLERVRAGFPPVFLPGLDTLRIARRLLPNLSRYALQEVAQKLQITVPGSHRAGWDALVTLRIWMKFLDHLMREGYRTLKDLEDAGFLLPPFRHPMARDIVQQYREEGEVRLHALHPDLGSREFWVVPIWLYRNTWLFCETRLDHVIRLRPKTIHKIL